MLRGFILEKDWTPAKNNLSQLTTYRGGSLIFFQDKRFSFQAKGRCSCQDAGVKSPGIVAKEPSLSSKFTIHNRHSGTHRRRQDPRPYNRRRVHAPILAPVGDHIYRDQLK